jgi:uncharacterized SAM-binding protein YcdF (DUF218 family)
MSKKLNRLKKWLAATVVLALVASYICRDSLLVEIGRAWAVNTPAVHTDALVVLGGGVDSRPAAAARLYHAGVAPFILYMNVKLTPTERLGILPAEAEITRRLLLSNNVPGTALVSIGTNVASTFDEACAVRDWATQHHFRSIEIVTDVFHTRRARWVFQKELADTRLELHFSGEPTLQYGLDDWWQHEEGVIAFQNEIAKYIYYRLKY